MFESLQGENVKKFPLVVGMWRHKRRIDFMLSNIKKIKSNLLMSIYGMSFFYDFRKRFPNFLFMTWYDGLDDVLVMMLFVKVSKPC